MLFSNDDLTDALLLILNGCFIGITRHLTMENFSIKGMVLSVINATILIVCVFAGLGIIFTELKYLHKMLIAGGAGFLGLDKIFDIAERILKIREYKR